MQPLVPCPPGRAHGVAAIDDQGVDSAAQKTRGHGQAGRTRADDEHLGIRRGHRQRSIQVAESRAQRRGARNAVGPPSYASAGAVVVSERPSTSNCCRWGAASKAAAFGSGSLTAGEAEQFGGDATQ